MQTTDEVSLDPADLPIRGGHRVETFGHAPSSSDLVDWVREGLDRDETVVLVTSATLQLRVVEAMLARRLPVAELIGDGDLVMLPVGVAVRAMTAQGDLDPTRCDALLGTLLRGLSERRGVRVLSEVADEAIRQLGRGSEEAVEWAWGRTLAGLDVAVMSVAAVGAGSRVPRRTA